MRRIVIYSGLLLAGLAAAQLPEIIHWRPVVQLLTMICLSYIMIEVGLEFSIDKNRLKPYAVDYGIAAGAAMIPWILCACYFVFVLNSSWKEAWLVGLFAAPTSAGILFTMLAAAGLADSWVFKKARILAIFDDLHTLFLIILLQFIFTGLKWQLAAVAAMTLAMIIASYRWLNSLSWPTRKSRLLLYGVGIALACKGIEHLWQVHLEVLLPSFALGCLVHHRASLEEGDDPRSRLDQSVKALFMFLAGASLPRISMQGLAIPSLLVHVVALTLLSNAGKCLPMLNYRLETGFRERMALSVAMFPRGEVGAGVLLIALNYGVAGLPVMLGSLSLALNLLMTGVFIKIVAGLTRYPRADVSPA